MLADPGRTAVLFLCGFLQALSLSAQTTESAGSLRGELVRFPDASVNVSVFATDVESIPPSLWNRLAQARQPSFLNQGAAALGDEVRGRLVSTPGVESVRDVGDPSQLQPTGVQVTEDGRIRLAWYQITEDQGVEILADGSNGDQGFSLRILIPNPTDTEDWWGLQAALSQAGIRRVQILSGHP